jgi:hypothetical protein
MATLLKVLNNLADIKSAGGVALRVRTQGASERERQSGADWREPKNVNIYLLKQKTCAKVFRAREIEAGVVPVRPSSDETVRDRGI